MLFWEMAAPLEKDVYSPKWLLHWRWKHLEICVVFCGGGSARRAPPTPPTAMDENKSTKTWSAWGGKVADLSKEKGQGPFPQWAFIGFILHRNTGKAHQLLSGSKDQK